MDTHAHLLAMSALDTVMDMCGCKEKRLKKRVRYNCAGAHVLLPGVKSANFCQLGPPHKKTQNSTFAAPSTIRVMDQAPQQPSSPQNFE
eukprot:6163537-Pleurochrysis_carterae.AAC.1